MTIGLTLRGCYLGSNVSYNVRKLVEKGYLMQERSVHDRPEKRSPTSPLASTLSHWFN
jgi:DNA-binding MarR family transcriptional regulator